MIRSKTDKYSETMTNDRRRFLVTSCALAIGASLASSPVLAAKDKIYTPFISNKALSGYDTVAYFLENKPVKGDNKYSVDYMGARWLFSSQENLDLFNGNPEKYAPQFGGYCAYAVATGTTAKGDPEQWEIVDDKLYLNINETINKRWSAKKDVYIPQGEANWPNVLN